jgi:hypothetical protein
MKIRVETSTGQEISVESGVGTQGPAGTITIGTVTGLANGEPPTVANSGTAQAAVLNFGIPEGDKGDKGDTATVAVGTVTTLAPDQPATVNNSGTSNDAVLNFGIPQGDQGDKGDKGDAATVAVGTVTTLDPDQPATVNNSGTSNDAVFNYGIPKGEPGDPFQILGPFADDAAAYTAEVPERHPFLRADGLVAWVQEQVITGIPYPTEDLTATYADQWFADNVAIPGETGQTYTVQVADDGKQIRCGNSDPVTVIYDVDAEAYRAARSLPIEQTFRLASCLSDMKSAGITPVWMTLGRSEFLARSGSTHHAVIGPNGTIGGSLPNNENGIAFDGASGNTFQFDNPAPFTNDYIWQIAVAIPNTTGATGVVVSGSVGNTGPFGPALRYDSDNNCAGAWNGLASTGSTLRTRTHAQAGGVSGVPILIGQQQTGSFSQPIKDIFPEFALAQAGGVWNNSSTWRLGAHTTNASRMNGTIALAMAGMGVLSRQQIYEIAAAIVRHNMASISPPQFMGFVGDSMTVSATGGINTRFNRSSLWTGVNASGWRGSFYDQVAVGGSSITAQEGFFNTIMQRMAWIPDMPRTIVFWGGYNAVSPFNFDSQANAEALADRYIAMAAAAADAGIKTVHWSRTKEGDVANGGAQANNMDHFNDYYKAAIAALPGDHIYYDHRITYPGPAQGGTAGTHFDGPDRNAAFFGDNIHCSQLGIETLVADFLSQYPNP